MAITLTKKKPKYKKLQKKYKKLDREFIDSGSMEKAREVYDVKTPFPTLAKKKIAKKMKKDEATIQEHGGKNVWARPEEFDEAIKRVRKVSKSSSGEKFDDTKKAIKLKKKIKKAVVSGQTSKKRKKKNKVDTLSY